MIVKYLTKVRHPAFFLAFIVLSSHALPSGKAYLRSGFTPDKAGFFLKVNGDVFPYRITSLFVLPDESQVVSINIGNADSLFELSGAAEGWEPISAAEWKLKAPRKSGLYPVRITRIPSRDSILVNVFVLVPHDRVKEGVLNGYQIGTYPNPPPSEGALYALPKGFVEVTKANKHTLISPHFRLSQFLCKQKGNYPKYVVLREKLPLKLEAALEALNENGVSCNSLTVMSGYRTPYYNRLLGNVKYSRHMWGDAADIFVDSEPRSNYIADLNGDGRRDHRDGEVLYRILNGLDEQPSFGRFSGGLAKYRATRYHGPFVHVDARGTLKRWNN